MTVPEAPGGGLDDLTPQPVDSRRSAELEALAVAADLRPRGVAEERCEGCRYYLNAGRAISYCWHPTLRVLVGSSWWCHWWEAGDRSG